MPTASNAKGAAQRQVGRTDAGRWGPRRVQRIADALMGRTTQESVLHGTGYIGIYSDNMSLLWLGLLGQDGVVIVRHEKKDSA